MSKPKEFPVDYSQHIAIVQALRGALDKVKHHQKFSARIKPAIEAVLPGYTVYIGQEGTFARVQVWGNGLTYEERVSLSWIPSVEKSWADAMAEEIERADLSDYAERQEGELALLPRLAELDRQVRELREKAAALIATLPAPKSAKCRVDAVFWSEASTELSYKFPLLFRRWRDDR